MSECSAVSESMPLLLTESLDPARRERAHQHIESCEVCGDEWAAYRETWTMMGDLPEVEVPARVRQQFLSRAGLEVEKPAANVVPFVRRPAFKWLAQAAAVVVIAGGGYFFGDRNADRIAPSQAQITSVTPIERVSRTTAPSPMAIAESRVLNADALSPDIIGRPKIANVQFVDGDPTDDQVGLQFDITSRWTVTGNPHDKSMVRLLSYMLEDENALPQRSTALEWVKRTYSDPAYADPEISNALAKVLRNDEHEGVRIHAVETLTNLPAGSTQTRDALIEALKSDPNPAVRLKAVEALANMARSGETLDAATVDTLRNKATQGDENMYVRVKAAEALRSIKP